LGAEFCGCASGDVEEPCLFFGGCAFHAFGDVGGNGEPGAGDLVFEAVVTALGKLAIDVYAKTGGAFPDFKVLELHFA
jgi:hypothetical protein